jgi:hypothetical protein
MAWTLKQINSQMGQMPSTKNRKKISNPTFQIKIMESHKKSACDGLSGTVK